MTKQALRSKYKEMRRMLPPGEIERLSENIVEQTLTHIQLFEKTISLFLPIERHKEVNTYLLWERARNVGATVAVPKSNFETMDMKHILFESTDQLEMNEKGIPEPKKGKVISADKFDIVFVPLLAADKLGNRVGYGKGFYDRFLRKCSPRCLFVGLHFYDLEEKIEDVLPTDVKLNAIITPEGILRFE